ncbi:MAG: glycosyltransferase family 4 protein [Planctomycetota bacterium]
MNVLHIGVGNMFGGIETFLIDVAAHRHVCPEMKPAFALCFEGRMSESLRATGVPVLMLGAMRASRPWSVWRVRRNLKALLKSNSFDAVIFHGTWSYGLLAGSIKNIGVKIVLWFHAACSESNREDRRALKVEPDAIIANSRYTAESLPRFFPNVHTSIVHCVVSPPDIGDPKIVRAEIRAELKTADDAVVILQVSRIEEWKGHRVLIDALSQLSGQAKWVCWIVGGPQRPKEDVLFDELKSKAKQLNVAERVQFLGMRQDVQRVMAAADCFCQPNTDPEPFGLVFVEALYAGKPVLTSAFGGALEIIDASCGMLVPPNDARALKDVLCKWITNESARCSLGQNGPARAAELCAPVKTLLKLNSIVRNI